MGILGSMRVKGTNPATSVSPTDGVAFTAATGRIVGYPEAIRATSVPSGLRVIKEARTEHVNGMGTSR